MDNAVRLRKSTGGKASNTEQPEPKAKKKKAKAPTAATEENNDG